MNNLVLRVFYVMLSLTNKLVSDSEQLIAAALQGLCRRSANPWSLLPAAKVSAKFTQL
jgi:hypothetical protein